MNPKIFSPIQLKHIINVTLQKMMILILCKLPIALRFDFVLSQSQ